MEKVSLENLKKLKDPKFYLENFCKVKTKERSLDPFILRDCQKDLFNTLNHHNRVIILKSRQLGFSTGIIGYFYHNTITTPATTTVIVGYNTPLTSELLDKVKTFYRSTPVGVRPTIHFNSKYEMSFPKIDSKIIVLPSTENVGRGYTINNCLCTEVAFWEKAEEKMISIEAAVPINGKLVIETTPKGMGNYFHRLWEGAGKKNDYIAKKYGWWWGYTEEEIETIRRRMNNPRKFAQEYGLEFLHSGRSVFDQNTIKWMRQYILSVGDKNPPLKDGDAPDIVESWDNLTIYRQPRPDHYYVAGADVAEGVEGGNYSTVVFFDRMTGEEVAFYKGLIPPDTFGIKLDAWGRKFNNALMAVEVNNHGLTTLTALKNRMYPSIYFRPIKLEGMGLNWTDKLGWKTTLVTRPLLIDDLAQALRDRDIRIHSETTLNEMTTFVYDDRSQMVPEEGCYDDCIFGTGIALQAFKVMSKETLTQLNYTQHLPLSFAY